jgi:hypothetical protein
MAVLYPKGLAALYTTSRDTILSATSRFAGGIFEAPERERVERQG